MFGSGNETLIISSEEMNDVMKIVKSLGKSGLLIRGVSQAVKNEAKEQKRVFLGTLLGTVIDTLLGNLLTGKDTTRAGDGATATSKGQGTIRAGQDF